MNKLIKYNVIIAVIILVAYMTSCTKEYPEVTYDPSVETTEVLNLKPDSVTITGYIAAGNEEFTEKGICYNTTGDPTVDDTKVIYTGDNTGATFQVILTGLDYTTTYYARAYGIISSGVLYGSDTTFTTPAAVPTVTTAAVTNVTNVSAVSGGTVVDWGGAEVTARGVCYSMYGTPTVDSLKTEDGDGIGDFVSNIGDLYGEVKYYFRAYATNSSGTGYGDVIEETTGTITVPELTTTAVTGVNLSSAISGGNITSSGGADVTARGLCWSTETGPVIGEDSVSVVGEGTGEFTDTIMNLEEGTDYYVRAYATNSEGTAYGEEFMFTTLTASFTPERIFVISNSTALGSIVPIPDTDHLFEWAEGDYEGFIWFPAGSLTFTFSDQETGGVVLGDDGGDGVLEFDGADITVAEEGFYKVRINVVSFEYSVTLVNFGVIGSAIPPYDWSVDVDMTYIGDEKLEFTSDQIHSGAWKIRANDAWIGGLNYGDFELDGFLDNEDGGGNIPIDAGNWKITVDFSEFPYSYTVEAVVK